MHGNYLKKSIIIAGLDPGNLLQDDKTVMNFGFSGAAEAKAWREILAAGQDVGLINDVETVDEVVDRLFNQYAAARQRLAF